VDHLFRRLAGDDRRVPFRYLDKGSMAVVGKNFAVLENGKLKLRGWPAFMVWAAVHLEFLAESSLRATVLLQWVWTYVTNQRGSRLIVDHESAAAASVPHEERERVNA